jgi:transposase
MPDERTWRDVRVCGITVLFHYTPREIICPTHGRAQEQIPWAAPNAQVTYRLEYVMLVYAQLMTSKAAAGLLGIPPSTFSDILHRTIKRIRSGHRIRKLRKMGIDEISYHNGKKYATLVYNLDTAEVVWAGQGKGSKTIDYFFTKVISEHQRKQIRWATCDMCKTFINAIKEHCPNATLVLDRFHIAKALNEAMDAVRKEEWNKLSRKDKNGIAIKGLRWLLFAHSSSRSPDQTRLLNQLKNSNRRIYRAWVLKDEFERFWDYTYPGAARAFAKKWMTAALKSRLEPIRDFVRTLQTHFENIITYLETHLTNAIGEGINRIIKIVKNRASGFYNFASFADLVYLTVGDVDIPAQIPKRFRTL